MKRNIIFSFVIPAHNEEDVIGKCLGAFKNQEHKDSFEIIVVNDGSTDATAKIAKSFNARVISFKEGHSAAFSRNRGAEIARGEVLIFLDADQIIEKDFCKKLYNFYKKENFNITGFQVYPHDPKTIFQKAWAAYRRVHICYALIIRKKIFLEMKKCDESLFYIEDDDLSQRLLNAGYSYKYPSDPLTVEHIDPATWNDFYRQRRWQGRGIQLKIFRKKDYSSFRYFIPSVLLLTLFFTPWLFLAYFVAYWASFLIKTKNFSSRFMLDSFYWVITDYIGRLIALYYFAKQSIINLKNRLKKSSS